jgi:hypothetical protein
MAAPDQLYRAVTRIFSVVVIGFGLAILAVTFANGGGLADAGFWLGLLFIAIGVVRLVIAVRSRD